MFIGNGVGSGVYGAGTFLHTENNGVKTFFGPKHPTTPTTAGSCTHDRSDSGSSVMVVIAIAVVL